MNEIVINLSRYPEALQEALRDQAIREKKSMKQLLSEIIQSASETILATTGKEAS